MQDETLWVGESASEVRDASGAKAPALIGNRFRVLDHVGSGAMGVVYRAEDTVLGRVVALKVLTASRTDAVSLARFRKEACALAQVRHENVVRLYSLGEHRGVPYFAMQYVEGPDLATIIGEHVRRGETVATARALDIVRQISAGLGAVHAHNLVHRDVKPNNVVIEKRTGRPILVDFGLARRRTASSPKLSSIGGTPSYMAPEQASDASGMRVSARSDLYALACTAFELLTGRTVFHGETGFAVLVAHAHTPAPRISSVRPELAPFDDAFARALAKSPDERQETCAAFVEELEEAARRIGASQLPTPPPTPASDGVRVLVFAPSDDVRTTIVPVLGRALRRFGSAVEIECVEREGDFVRSFARSRADIVIVDDDAPGRRADALVAGLRHAQGGRDAEVLLLGGNRSAARLDELGARELPRPLSSQVLGVALARMGDRIVERRARADRREP